MNKIIINEDNITKKLDNSIQVDLKTKTSFLDVKPLYIKIFENTNLQIEYTSTDETKLEIYINVLPNVKANIYELKTSGSYKLQYKYYLEENSELNIFKFNDVQNIKEMTIVNLNGIKSKFTYNLKTISKNYEKYDLMVYHNAGQSESLINNIGVNVLEGRLGFNVSGFVPNDIKKCTLNQNNRIINLTNNECIIKPNLFIDEEDVIANHSALIGKFNDEELFYLMSRGIDKKEAENLLVKGLLLKNMDIYKEEIEKRINTYWR